MKPAVGCVVARAVCFAMRLDACVDATRGPILIFVSGSSGTSLKDILERACHFVDERA